MPFVNNQAELIYARVKSVRKGWLLAPYIFAADFVPNKLPQNKCNHLQDNLESFDPKSPAKIYRYADQPFLCHVE